jgi:hypothetical protein
MELSALSSLPSEHGADEGQMKQPVYPDHFL